MAESPRTVLVIEDYEELRALAEEILGCAGYTVLAFRNGESAIEAAARHAGAIDLLLTDVVLPDISGPDVATRLMASRPSMKVLLMSGYSEVASGLPLIQKPFMAADLLARIREMLGA